MFNGIKGLQLVITLIVSPTRWVGGGEEEKIRREEGASHCC